MSLPDGRWFKLEEFRSHDGATVPNWPEAWLTLVGLCDAVRDEWGGPLQVISGYRSPAWNRALVDADAAKGTHGVASGSYHTRLEAADLRPVGGGDAAMLHRTILSAHLAGRLPTLGGIGLYPASNWVHVDCHRAADGHLRRWLGT